MKYKLKFITSEGRPYTLKGDLDEDEIWSLYGKIKRDQFLGKYIIIHEDVTKKGGYRIKYYDSSLNRVLEVEITPI